MANDANLNTFIDSWSETVLKMWRGKMLALNVYDEGKLYESLKDYVGGKTGEIYSKIVFEYLEYGIYVDIGTGREVSRGNSGDLGFSPKRKQKQWYSKVFYREVMKLKEYMAYRVGAEAAGMISMLWANAFDQRYAQQNRTVSSLRTQLYRKQQAVRNQRNYYSRRLGPNWEDWLKQQGKLAS